MLIIDGSQGEGGGQMLRSALALSLITGQPFRINQIRAKRDKPGLRQQHLTCVLAAAEIGQAEVQGAAVGSLSLFFRPSRVAAGDYVFDIGTAGSTSLVLQTVMPPLWLASGPSRVEVHGGTHSMAAPPYEFLANTFLPLVAEMGPCSIPRLLRHGFFPVGGGQVSVAIQPVARLAPLELLSPPVVELLHVRALVSRLPLTICERELQTLGEALAGWNTRSEAVEITDARGPGNVVLIESRNSYPAEVFAGFGRRGTPAEVVASEAAAEALAWLEGQAPVGSHLADQLILPLGLAGEGVFRTGPLTEHSRTNMAIVEQFLQTRFRVTPEDSGTFLVSCGQGE